MINIKHFIYTVRPHITDLKQVDEQTIKIKWVLANQNSKTNLTRYIISFTTNRWASSSEWPSIILTF